MLLLKQAYTPPTIAVQPLPYTLHHGDCIAVMRTLPENSIDAIVTDPPCGIGFMSAKWDTFDDKTHKSRQVEKEERTQEGKWLEGRGTLPYGFSASLGHSKKERENFIAFMTEVMREALRCLKPGGHAFVWALPRTSHWTATALEDAGFEIRDVVTHLFGSGFPKSHDISKAIDREAGKEREIAGFKQHARDGDVSSQAWTTNDTNGNKSTYGNYPGFAKKMLETKPATPDAIRYAGYGTALKPASEHWILCRKPLSEPTIAANVLKHGTGGLNIDKSRIGTMVEPVEWCECEEGDDDL